MPETEELKAKIARLEEEVRYLKMIRQQLVLEIRIKKRWRERALTAEKALADAG